MTNPEHPTRTAFWRPTIIAAIILLAGLTAAVGIPPAPAAASGPPVEVIPVVSGLDIPWDVTFLPDGTMLYDQRAGGLWVRTTSGQVRKLTADFKDLYVGGESGLMGLVVDPSFGSNRTIYSCQAYTNSAGYYDIRVIKWQLDSGLTAAARTGVVLQGITATGRHSGCRLRFDDTGYLFIGTGDAANGTNPQDLTSLNGKVLRITTAGQPAPGNPFLTSGNTSTRLIYTYGHRNVQGLSLRPGTNEMWSVEQGTGRDDEVNRLVPGGNYGYDPVPGYNESVPMTDLVKYPSATAAVFSTGDPTLALSGGTWLSGSQWGSLDGTFVAAALKASSVRVLTVNPQNTLQSVTDLPELSAYGRLRSPIQGPDGALYVTTSNGSNQDMILKVTPRSVLGDTGCGVSGANLATPVGAVATSGGVTAFVVGQDRALWYRKVDNGSFANLSGIIQYGPGAVSWDGKRIDVFVVGTDGLLNHGYLVAGRWSGWETLGGRLTSSPTAVSFSTGTLSVFARGADLALWTRRWTGQQWTPWASLGGVLSASPQAVVDPDTSAGQIGVRGSDGRAFTATVRADGFAGPFVSSGYVSCSAVSYAARRNDGTNFLSASVGRTGRLEVVNSSLVTADGLILGSVALVAPGTSGFAALGRGGSGSLWMYDARNGAGKWVDLGGTML